MGGTGRDLAEDEHLIVTAFNAILSYVMPCTLLGNTVVDWFACLLCKGGQWLDNGLHGDATA
jgi:hypothetical protein